MESRSLNSTAENFKTAKGVSALDKLIFPVKSLSSMRELVLEWNNRARLAARGLAPRCNVLIHGPVGTGKAHCARLLSDAVGLPLVTVPTPEIFSCDEETAVANLYELAERVRTTPAVHLIPNLEPPAGARGLAPRVASALTYVLRENSAAGLGMVVVTATRRPEIPEALAQRFDLVCSTSNPDGSSTLELAGLVLGPVAASFGKKTVTTASGLSHGEIARAFQLAAKRCLMAGREPDEAEVVKALAEARAQADSCQSRA